MTHPTAWAGFDTHLAWAAAAALAVLLATFAAALVTGVRRLLVTVLTVVWVCDWPCTSRGAAGVTARTRATSGCCAGHGRR